MLIQRTNARLEKPGPPRLPPASQSFAGSQAFTAASARWRAEHGLRPLDANAVKSYVAPEQIRDPLGQELPAALQRIIFDAWIAGFPLGVSFWLSGARERGRWRHECRRRERPGRRG